MTKLSEIGSASILASTALEKYRRALDLQDAAKVGPGDVAEKKALWEAATVTEAAQVAGYAASPEAE